MSQRTYASIMCGLIFLWVITPALAGDWTIVEGGTYPISAQIGGGADLQPGDSIIINGATNDDPVTIQIDSATVPALGDAIGAAISITAAVDVTIEFQGTNRLPLGDAANTSLEISGSGGSLLVTNAGGATGYFDFSANSNKILTIDGPVTGADAVNKFVMGNNTLRTQTAAVDLNQVTLGGANAKIDTAIATTIKTLAIAAAGNDLNIAIAEDLTLTITDAFTIPAASVVTLTAAPDSGSRLTVLQ